MSRLTSHSWRFGLRFKRVCPFAIGDGVLSGVTDDFGTRVRFAGSAHVEKYEVAMESSGQIQSRAVVKVYPPVV